MELWLRLGIIGAGGFIGAILRYLVSGWIQERSGSITFPFGTLGVNLLGCFVIGCISLLVETRSMFSVEMRSFLLIGLLGAFTTFSTFGNETLTLIRDGRMELAALNSCVQVFVGVAMVWLGRIVAAGIWR